MVEKGQETQENVMVWAICKFQKTPRPFNFLVFADFGKLFRLLGWQAAQPSSASPIVEITTKSQETQENIMVWVIFGAKSQEAQENIMVWVNFG